MLSYPPEKRIRQNHTYLKKIILIYDFFLAFTVYYQSHYQMT